ncbi:MAG: sodium ion-translocating decarboxylase subunit beta [Bacteroidales bacterium OttesenSCG-928-I14]|jgi:oxaloacetate decarboxylase beta subunit|nr:sodium ion-translocating decarboxylase subunit beta [Bacteroidales bacterium OttesenSCG-928-I14]
MNLFFHPKSFETFWKCTEFANISICHIVMIIIGLAFICLAVIKEFAPIFLIPIGFGILIGNIPFLDISLQSRIYEESSVFNFFYQGITNGWYTPIIFLGIGAMTDFSSIMSNPKLILIGIVSQLGIFISYILALIVGFNPHQAGSIGIIGVADAPTAIFISSKLDPDLVGTVAISAYFYIVLIPLLQPHIMRLFTTKKEKIIRMKLPRVVSHTEKILFPIFGVLLTGFVVPSGLPLFGMLFLGNLLKETNVTRRLSEVVRGPLMNIVVILLGISVGFSTKSTKFLTCNSMKIFILGILSFVIITIMGILCIKFFNLFLRSENKINPLIGNASISGVSDSAHISQMVGLEYDSSNYLLMHAMGPNVAGLIGSTLIAGVLLELIK